MEIEHLSFAYDKTPVLRDVSFRVEKGKVTTLLGANGCGKSTLFYLMTKNLTPDGGRVTLGGRNIKEVPLREFARQVAIVHQNNTASRDITVEKLVSYGRTPYSRMMRGADDEDARQIARAMEVTNLTKYRDREVMSLSGGQRQRVWIAMAIAQNTRFLFLDEPTTYLDVRYQIETLELIRRLNETLGITILMVLHDMNQAVDYSDRIVGLKDGRICVEGVPGEVVTPDAIEQLYGIRLPVKVLDGKKIILTTRRKEDNDR